MDASWTREDLDRLASLVQDLLTRPLTAADLPRLRWALAAQQAFVEHVYRVEGQREALMQALTAEVERLQRALDGEGPSWDEDDLRW